MDILYIVGKGLSQWQDNELRYSLRSIAKYGRNIDRVYIAGFCPSFVNREAVTYIKVRDEVQGKKHHNILHCILEAVRLSDIGNDFLYSSDDHYYIRPTDFDSYPFFCKGVLPEKGSGQYQHSLQETRELLETCGLPFLNYSWHGNTHFRRDLIESPRFQKLCKFASLTEEGVEPTCLMLNYWQAVEGFPITEREDYKSSDEDLEKNGRECISSAAVLDGHSLADFLRAEFPNKCKYEY